MRRLQVILWTGALRKRGELDSLPELVDFAAKLERAVKDTIESGKMTGDLAGICTLDKVEVLDSKEFIEAIRYRLNQ